MQLEASVADSRKSDNCSSILSFLREISLNFHLHQFCISSYLQLDRDEYMPSSGAQNVNSERFGKDCFNYSIFYKETNGNCIYKILSCSGLTCF
jgi:hypothetical protein